MEWRDVRWWMESEDSKNKSKITLSFEAGEIIRKWVNAKQYEIQPGIYYDDGLPRVQDINGFHKLDVINKNVNERKSFVGRSGAGVGPPAPPKNVPVRSATGKARTKRG